MKTYILLLSIFVILIGCSGDEVLQSDKIPPAKPVLIEHLGDNGDVVFYNDETITLDDNNNGIDAVEDGDNIKIQWLPILDTDIEFIHVYRYNEYQTTEPDLTTLAYDSPYNEYIDTELHNLNPLGIEWFYYIIVEDRAGNTTKSDTVSYTLIDKAFPKEPYQGQQYDQVNDIVFKWDRSDDALWYRVVLFDEFDNYLWSVVEHVGVIEDPGDSLSVSYPDWETQYFNQKLKWRLDAFKDDGGSESRVIEFSVD